MSQWMYRICCSAATTEHTLNRTSISVTKMLHVQIIGEWLNIHTTFVWGVNFLCHTQFKETDRVIQSIRPTKTESDPDSHYHQPLC